MPIKIEAKEEPLHNVFSSHFDFFIPLYQRPYAWTTKEADELISDLLDNMGDLKTGVDEINPYFLGSVVLVKGETSKADVVDGQQRLTTFTILFAALRTLLTLAEAAGATTLLYEDANPILGTQNRYRLTMRPQDSDFFQTYVQHEGGIEKLKSVQGATLSDSRKNIRENECGAQYEQQTKAEEHGTILSSVTAQAGFTDTDLSDLGPTPPHNALRYCLASRASRLAASRYRQLPIHDP